MNQKIVYPNGLRVVVDTNSSVRSVAAGIWVGAGSVKESARENGISHFTEHVMFKGTDKYSAFDIANAFEGYGANVNAFTGKEATCYYVKSVDEYAERSFQMLSHIFLYSVYDPDELDKERKVIVEEINMEEDSPEDICYDLLAATMYPNSSLGHTILGPIENVNRFTREDVLAYREKFYNADNIVVSFSGNITPEEADRLVRRYFIDDLSDRKSTEAILAPIAVTSKFSKRIKDFEQTNVGISYPSVPFGDPRYAAQSIFGILFGGGMSSRLFQRIREQMGLAYSVYASPLLYTNNGNFDILLNITAANTKRAVEAVKKEIDEVLAKGITEEEFLRAKIQMKSSLVFSQESVQSRMTAQGKFMLLADKLYSVDQRIADADAVTKEEVERFLRALFVPNGVCAAYVGKPNDTDIMEILRRV